MEQVKASQARASTAILLAMTAFAVSVNSIPPLITSMASEFGFAFESFGAVFSIEFAAFAIAAYLLPKLARKLKNGVPAAVFLGILGMGIVLISIIAIRKFYIYYLWAILLGFACGLVEPGGSVLISVLEKPGSGKLMNLSQAFYCLGGIAAPQVAALILYSNLSWEYAFVIVSVFIVLIAVFFRGLIQPDIFREDRNGANVLDNDKDSPPLYKNRLFILLAVSIFFYVCVEGIFVCWLPAYFEKVYILSPSAAATRLSIYWIGLVIGRFTAAFIPSRVGKWLVTLISCIALALITVGLLLAHNPLSSTLIVLAVGIAAGPVWPGIVSIGSESSGQAKFTASLVGIGALGLVFGPVLSGWIIRSYSFEILFISLVGILVVVTFVLFLAYYHERSAVEKNKRSVGV
jgi:fucose permease